MEYPYPVSADGAYFVLAMIFLCISGVIVLFLRLDLLKVFYLFCGVFLTACMAFLIFSKREWFDEHYGLAYNGYEVGYRDFEDRLSYEAVVLMLWWLCQH